MPPPQLAGNAPVLDILHPIPVAVLEFGGMELNRVVHHTVKSGLGKLFHGHEPLHGQAWLNDGACAL